ncbi:unnamed protein product [Hymenolepis diminuta]|uniref:Uncharacterized protein n=1 Tax=Hymenolepis diminuta TaxID=6216 RepID=A0A0R3SL53_HYMDI|nr:unnamed protein product [Hymenolepis diminuta]
MYEHRDQSEAWSFAAVHWLIISHVYSCCRRKAAANGASHLPFSYCGIYINGFSVFEVKEMIEIRLHSPDI